MLSNVLCYVNFFWYCNITWSGAMAVIWYYSHCHWSLTALNNAA